MGIESAAMDGPGEGGSKGTAGDEVLGALPESCAAISVTLALGLDVDANPVLTLLLGHGLLTGGVALLVGAAECPRSCGAAFKSSASVDVPFLIA